MKLLENFPHEPVLLDAFVVRKLLEVLEMLPIDRTIRYPREVDIDFVSCGILFNTTLDLII